MALAHIAKWRVCYPVSFDVRPSSEKNYPSPCHYVNITLLFLFPPFFLLFPAFSNAYRCPIVFLATLSLSFFSLSLIYKFIPADFTGQRGKRGVNN